MENLAPVLIVCSAAIVRDTKPSDACGDHKPFAVCDVCGGDRNLSALYPIWKIRFQTPIVMGSKFYVSRSPADDLWTNPELGYEGMVGPGSWAVFLGRTCRIERTVLETIP